MENIFMASENADDLSRAVAVLKNEKVSLVFCRGDRLYRKDGRGIGPLLAFADSGENLSGYAVADKIVGKAAALLFIRMRACAVYGAVMSKAAYALLRRHGIAASYGVLAEQIRNRAGTDICPMERAVCNVENPAAVCDVLHEALQMLQRKGGNDS